MMDDINLVAMGGSAGSLQPIIRVLEYLKPGFPIPLLLVLHRSPAYSSPLEHILHFKTNLIAREIEEKDKIEPGYIYICPADYHVLIETNRSFSLDDSEKVNFSRPSIDVVFKSASDVYKEKLLCILFSGANADGAAGMLYAKNNGGSLIIQDPEEAEVPYMPLEALKRFKADHVLNTHKITGYLNSLVI